MHAWHLYFACAACAGLLDSTDDNDGGWKLLRATPNNLLAQSCQAQIRTAMMMMITLLRSCSWDLSRELL